jgi:hypothetical protein
VNAANTRDSRGVDATGVGAIDCARHNMKRPLSVGDLQKGERYVFASVLDPSFPTDDRVSRYVNMDYLFFSGLQHSRPPSLVISYDIACQWHRNLWKRMDTYPYSLQLDPGEHKFTFVVPKFHLPAHVEKCQTTFSLNLEVGMGRTDGEAPERGWANTNRISSSTKEMGPGTRRDMLDDHFGDWNWKKVYTMGEP